MVGEIIKPNFLQKFLHRFFMLRPVTIFFSTRVNGIDDWVLKVTHGKHTLSEFMGWYVVQLKTVGAKTGRNIVVHLVALLDGEKIGLVASNLGRRHNPSWYYNLKKNPECEIQFGTRVAKFIARETEGDEYEKYWQMAVSYYAGYEKYKERAAHRHIPVMLLEPKK